MSGKRLFILLLVYAVIFGMVGFFVSGCSNHPSEYVNQYLVGCAVDDEGAVVLDINLPDGFHALIYQAGVPEFAQLALETGVYNIGILEAGEYEYTLELVQDERVGNFIYPPRAYDGLIETCIVIVESMDDPIDPPDDPIDPPDDPVDPPDDPDTPTVNVNIEGGLTVVITGVDEDCPISVHLLCQEVAECNDIPAPPVEEDVCEDQRVLDITEDTVVVFRTDPGVYLLRVIDCEGIVLYETEVVITGDVDELVDEDDFLPPAWGRHKILVCHKGNTKLLPYPAACNLIRKGKATLGACN